MKKLLLLILLGFSLHSNAQVRKESFSNKKTVDVNQRSLRELDLYRKYNKATAACQGGALICAAVSAGIFINYGCMDKKFKIDEKGNSRLTDKARGHVIAGGAMAALAVILEVCAIDLKIEAGQYLELHLRGNQAALSYTF